MSSFTCVVHLATRLHSFSPPPAACQACHPPPVLCTLPCAFIPFHSVLLHIKHVILHLCCAPCHTPSFLFTASCCMSSMSRTLVLHLVTPLAHPDPPNPAPAAVVRPALPSLHHQACRCKDTPAGRSVVSCSTWYAMLNIVHHAQHGTPMLNMVHQCSTWYTNAQHGTPMLYMVHQCSTWYTNAQHGTPMLNMVHQCSTWCHAQYGAITERAAVRTLLQAGLSRHVCVCV